MPELSSSITTVYEAIENSAERFGDRTAIRFLHTLEPEPQDQSLNFREFFALVNQSARLLQSLMNNRRGVVSILAPNIPQNHALLWAAESVGIANPLNPLLNEDALYSLMSAAETDIIVALGPNPMSDIWEKAQAVSKRLPKQPKCVSLMIDGGDLFYDQLVGQYDASPLSAEERPAENDIAAYFHTGGTTGVPKLAMHSHRNQIATARAYYQAVYNETRDVAINGLPLFHVAGAMVLGLGNLVCGGEQILPTAQGFRNPQVIARHWQLVEHYGVTVTGGIPTSVASMMEVPVGDADISSIRFMVSGGSPVPAPLVLEVREKTGLELHQIFGMTECAGAATMPNANAPAIAGAAGYIDPAVEIKIDERGEICLRGPQVFPGYLGIDDKPVDEDGWLHTGDLGHIDNNYLFITGRAKDLIIRSGHNIDPAMIENCLDAHPSVTMSAAVGKPDHYAGELPVAFVQLHAGDTTSAETLREFAMANIAERPACPKEIFIVEEMPVTAVGKIHKPTLRELAARSLVEETLADKELPLPEQLTLTIQKSGVMAMSFESAHPSTTNALKKLASELSWQLLN